MIGSGQIITQGVETFTPAVSRTLEIANELAGYIIWICLGILGITLLRNAVKYIMGYLSGKANGTFYDRRARRVYGYRGKEKRTKYDDKELNDAIKYGR